MAELVMKYQRYAEYKDSGIEWLGEVPNEWRVVKLSYKIKLASGDTLTANDIEPIGQYAVYGGNGLRGYTKNYNCDGSYILIGRQGALCGNINLAKGRFFATEHAVVVYPYEEFNITFLSGFLEFMDLGQYSVSAAQPGLSVDRINALHILVPPINEQTRIGKFLDHETAQIDTLIEKQQTLIQLLKEKRQAVISHAVTKGLNPDAPMKDSGVEWLGVVPEHWQVKRIKHYGKIMGGFAFKSDDFIDSGYPVLKISNVSHLQLNFDDESFLPLSFVEKHLEYKVEENDLVFAMTRPIISGGIKVAKIPKLEAMPLVNQRVGFLKLKSELLADFILYSSLSSSFKAQFKNNMTITNQPNISGEGIESVALPMPPKNELVEIVDFLNNSETVFQNLSIKSEQQVELLKERRTALISAAVTGKIDVRGWRASDVETVL